MGALLARARAAACLLGLSLHSILGDSAILLSEPNDFDEVCRAAVGRHLRTLHSCLPALVAGWSCFARAHFARQVFESDLCWLVLFTSLHELDVEEEAKRRFLLLPHYVHIMRVSWVLYGAVVVALLALPFFAPSINGARRWQ